MPPCTADRTSYEEMRMTSTIRALALACLAAVAIPAMAQVGTEQPAVVPSAKKVTVQRLTVHAPTIANNLEGNAADRTVFVVLPPGYAANSKRRYPVVYALHGYSIGAEQWMGEIHAPQTIEGAFARGANEMILVFPDSKTVHNGSMYSMSPTTGDFETFISRDLIAYVDAHYRTIARRDSRGLFGHSMGGYGATRIGMRHSDMFGAVYMMSPCCLSARGAFTMDAETATKLAQLKSPAESATLPWIARAQLAAAAAWSPNPKRPPLYLDLPSGDEQQRNEVLAKWAANAPLAFADQYVGKLRDYRAIAIDVGDQDGLKEDAAKLHALLDSYGIANSFEIYSGTHTSNVAFRIQDFVLPFFSKHLSFEAKR
jgi:enterochelin esterase-like enzyme